MRTYNPTKDIGWDNYAIKADYYTCDRTDLQRTEYFSSAREFAEWLDAFPYCKNSDVIGWSGDSATMEAVESYRKESGMRAVPEFITEFDPNDPDDKGRAIGADEFNRLFRVFNGAADLLVSRWDYPGGHVYGVMGGNVLVSYVWHVPSEADYLHT